VYQIGIKLILEFSAIELKENRKPNVAKSVSYTDCRLNHYIFQN